MPTASLTKTCTSCFQDLPTSRFRTRKDRPNKLHARCDDCTIVWSRRHSQNRLRRNTGERPCTGCGVVKLPAEFGRQGSSYECRACASARTKAHRILHPKSRLATVLRHTYGIGLDEYEAMAAVQGGACAICLKPPSGRYSRLSVDHDHDTEMVRGLLCPSCNTAIGLLGDDPDTMRRASAYVARHIASAMMVA